MQFLRRPLRRVQLTYSAGGQSQMEIPREHFFQALEGQFRGTLNVNLGAGTAVATVRAPWSIIQRIEFILNGKDTLVSVPALSEYVDNILFYNRAPATSFATANGNNTVEFDFAINFTAGLRDLRGIIASHRTSSIVLRVTWGNVADFVTLAGGATATLTGELYVQSNEIVNAGQAYDTSVLIQRTSYDVTNLVTGENILELPRGHTYQRLQLHVYDNGELSGTALTNLRLVQDTVYTHFDEDPNFLLQRQRRMYQEDLLAGLYVVDFDYTRDTQNMMPTAGMSTFQLIATLGAGLVNPRIVVVPVQWIYLPQAAPKPA